MNELSKITLPCMCATLRRTSRALTQLYEEELRPAGLRATQLTILQVLSLAGELTQGELGKVLAMDSTTLTRTLAIMDRSGWIAKRRGTDRREWRLRLSKAGEDQFKLAVPLWEKAQSRLRQQLGEGRKNESQWNELMKLNNRVTQAVTEGALS
jgi:DNA-binding MarR family transcriptional regulator